jgi:hypothetical protein
MTTLKREKRKVKKRKAMKKKRQRQEKRGGLWKKNCKSLRE